MSEKEIQGISRFNRKELSSAFFVLLLMIIGSKTRLLLGEIPLVFTDAIVIAWTLYRRFPLSILPTVLFLMMGTLGLPVFASGLTGAAAWESKTAGYLAGYLLVSLLPVWLMKKEALKLSEMFIWGLLLYLTLQASGMTLLIYRYEMSIEAFIKNVFIPLAPFGITKTIIAVGIVHGLKKTEQKATNR
jgi:biotin transport system substrate-specific component